MPNIRIILLLLAVSVAVVVCQRADYSHNVTVSPITIMTEEGPLSDHLQKMVDLYTHQTGNRVILSIRKKESFRNEFTDEMKLRSDQYNLVLIDPLWLGYGVKNGYFIEFTNWLLDKKIDQSFQGHLQKLYTEYPSESGKIWGIPASYDALGIIYRKDIFDHSVEKKVFREKYKKDLSPPQSLEELEDLMSFFFRPEKDVYPLEDFTKAPFGFLSALYYSLVSYSGGSFVSEQKNVVRGYLNTRENAEVLKRFKDMYKKALVVPREMNKKNQTIVMSFDKYSNFQKMLSRDGTKNQLGFVPFFKNRMNQRATIKGKIFVVVGYAPNKDQTFEFLEWFTKEETQILWSRMGEVGPNQKILSGAPFYNDGMYRKELMQGIEGAQRMMMLPEYFDLVDAMDEDLVQYIKNNKVEAYSVLRNIAKKWEHILEQAGYYKE